jgi:hypothetical protein
MLHPPYHQEALKRISYGHFLWPFPSVIKEECFILLDKGGIEVDLLH